MGPVILDLVDTGIVLRRDNETPLTSSIVTGALL